ncbi:hypothetical protein [Sphingomonas sp. RS2018]
MGGFQRWGETLPATTAKPEPDEAGMIVHAYYDVSIYAGTNQAERFAAAVTDDEVASAAQNMPFATVKFYQLHADEPMLDPMEPDVVLPY